MLLYSITWPVSWLLVNIFEKEGRKEIKVVVQIVLGFIVVGLLFAYVPDIAIILTALFIIVFIVSVSGAVRRTDIERTAKEVERKPEKVNKETVREYPSTSASYYDEWKKKKLDNESYEDKWEKDYRNKLTK